jgi:hypothetical protein
MYARWGTFAVGLGLVFAPLVLGYRSVAPILHDVTMGSLVCIATLAALERPRARFALLAPALWLIGVAPSGSERAAALAELAAGALLLVLAAIPSARLAQRLPRVAGSGRARA